MSDTYESIPDSPGRHPGDTSDHEASMGVRAQNPPSRERSGRPAYQYALSYHAGRGRYRVRAWQGDQEPRSEQKDYVEQGRYSSDEDLAAALEELPQQERYVVFENTETGRVLYGRENNLSDNWTGGGEFDQVTIFASEDEAATYADQRKDELGAGDESGA